MKQVKTGDKLTIRELFHDEYEEVAVSEIRHYPNATLVVLSNGVKFAANNLRNGDFPCRRDNESQRRLR